MHEYLNVKDFVTTSLQELIIKTNVIVPTDKYLEIIDSVLSHEVLIPGQVSALHENGDYYLISCVNHGVFLFNENGVININDTYDVTLSNDISLITGLLVKNEDKNPIYSFAIDNDNGYDKKQIEEFIIRYKSMNPQD